MATPPPPPPPPTHAVLAKGRLLRRGYTASATPAQRLSIHVHEQGPTTSAPLPRPLPRGVLTVSDPFGPLRAAKMDDDDAQEEAQAAAAPLGAHPVHPAPGPGEEDVREADDIQPGHGEAAPAAAAADDDE